jgi:hypothetical protein
MVGNRVRSASLNFNRLVHRISILGIMVAHKGGSYA